MGPIDWSALADFSLAKVRFLFRAKETIALPQFKGATFRGAFGYAFRDMTCSTHLSECSKCPVSRSCLYQYVFETHPPEDAEMMRLYPKAPHPFVIEPPDMQRQILQSGEPFFLSVVLVGRAVSLFPQFVYAFMRIGEKGLGKERGRFVVERVESVSANGNCKELYNEGTLGNGIEVTCARDFLEIESPSRLMMRFETPTRIKFDGSYSSDPEFHILVRSLLRRVSALQYFHCGGLVKLDFRGAIQQAENVKRVSIQTHWCDWQRYSTRQKTRMKLGGFVGTAEYDEGAHEFLPLLRLGEFVHVGKAATFGMGKYVILRTTHG